MKLRSFMQDTMSFGSMGIPIRPIIESYKERYLSLKKRVKFTHMIYEVMPGSRHMVHVKVPSETITGEPFYYDVLLELAGDTAATFSDCDVKFFSNCPSFVYNLSYVMAHWVPEAKPDKRFNNRRVKGDTMLIPGLSQKLGPQPTKDKPVIRNPLGIPMLDKSLYFAIFYIMENLTWQEVASTHNNVHIGQVAVSVADFDHLMVDRKRAENRDKKKKEDGERKVKAAMAKHERSIQSPKGILHAKQPTSTKKPVQVKSTMRKPQSPKHT